MLFYCNLQKIILDQNIYKTITKVIEQFDNVYKNIKIN